MGLVPAARLLQDRLAMLERLGVASDLVLHRPLQAAEAVEILHLDLRAEALLAHRSQADVPLDAHRAGLHVAVAGTDVTQDAAQRLAVGAGLCRRTDVRLGDDLHEGDPGPIEVDQRVAAPAMLHARRVFFEVRAGDADGDIGPF